MIPPTEVTRNGIRYRVVSAWPIFTKYTRAGQTTKRIGWGLGLAKCAQ